MRLFIVYAKIYAIYETTQRRRRVEEGINDVVLANLTIRGIPQAMPVREGVLLVYLAIY